MIQKSNKVIIFAVIAVIIVAVPISFYELPRGGNHVPINVTDGKITCSYLFSGNFMNSCDCSFHPEKNVSLSAYVQESGYNKTSINLTAYKIGTCPVSGESCVIFFFRFTLNGSFFSNVIPTKMILYQNFTSPNDTFIRAIAGDAFTCNCKSNGTNNLTYHGAHKVSALDHSTIWYYENCLVFDRPSFSTNSHSINLYNFSFFDGVNTVALDYPIILDQQYRFDNTFVFLGLEKPIVLTMDFNWTDVKD